MPCSITSFLSSGPSPAILPRAKTIFWPQLDKVSPTKKWIHQTQQLWTQQMFDSMMVRADADSALPSLIQRWWWCPWVDSIFSTEEYIGSKGCNDFHISNVDTWHLKNYWVMKSTSNASQILTPLAKCN